MAPPRFPPRRTLLIATAALVVIVAGIALATTGGKSDKPNASVTPGYIPTDRNLTEDPCAIISRADLEAAFGSGVKFRKYQENSIKAQGVQNKYTEDTGAFTVDVTEIKGDEAGAAWRRLSDDFSYPTGDPKEMGPTAKFQPDLVVAVYRNEMFVSVILSGDKKPTDGAALRKLGKRAHEGILERTREICTPKPQ